MKTRVKYGFLLVAGWSLVGVITTSQLYIELMTYDPGRPFPFTNIFTVNLLQWNFWALATPIIAWLGRRFPIEKGSLAKGIIVHILASLLVAAVHVAYIVAVTLQFGPADMVGKRGTFLQFFFSLSYTYHIELMIYWAMLGMTLAMAYYSKFRERELRASQLETQLAQANLQALEMQLQPHFLFNTLNGIATLVRDKRNDAAVEMLVGVSELLRQVLDKMGQQEVTLKEEMEFIESYLQIQQMRFGDHLKVSIDIAPETLDARVPNLVLQPIVENAIRHGLGPKVGGGNLKITSDRSDGTLVLSVFNDGVRLNDEFDLTENSGLGLTNTRERLYQLYGDEQSFTLKNTTEGVLATINIPLSSDSAQIGFSK